MGWDPPLLTGRSDHQAKEAAECGAPGGLFMAGENGGPCRGHPEDKRQLSGWGSSAFLGHSLTWLILLTPESWYVSS